MIKSFLKRTSRRFNLNKEDGFHIYYAMGVARGDQYASFQSLGSSIKQGLDFIHENRARFVGHTFYAHNGGSYDATFLFKEGLLEDDRLDIPEPPVGQDGKYIHFKVVVGGDTVITFRDSLRLLPQGLEKLCKEFDVEHKKLTETVCHDDITVENWDTFPQLHTYLENDCKGLLECLVRFRALFRRSIYTRKETSNRICSDIEDWWPRKTRGVRNLSRCDCYADCAIEIEGRIFI